MSKLRQKNLPFQGLNAGQWGNLAIISILLTYILIFIANISALGLFNYVGLDYRTFYTSAQIAFNENFAAVYNLDMQSQYQRPIYELYKNGTNIPSLEIVPTPYFPIFVLPFLIFIPLQANIGFYIYTVSSLVIIILYTFRLIKIFQIQSKNYHWIILMVLAFLPVFLNSFYGQINLLILVAFGEFLISKHKNKRFIAGLWLSIWLVKPQTLILLLPLLLLTRNFRILAGFSVGTLGIFVASTLVAGCQWIPAWLSLLLKYSGNLATTNPFAMANLRSLLINLDANLGPHIAWSITVAVTILISYWMLKITKTSTTSEKHFGISILAIYAGTCILTWHSHIHMVAPIIVPLLYLHNKTKNNNLWAIMIGLPFLGLVISFALSYWFSHNNLQPLFMLVTNIIIIYWCYRQIASNQDNMLVPG
jgi:hypothetical protein